MESWKTVLAAAVILIPLSYLLYYFGIGFTSKACFAVFHADCSLPTHWKGTFLDASGYMRRNFLIFKKFSKLAIEIESTSGTMGFEVKDPDGSILSPLSGTYGRNASVLLDVSRFKRCSVTLRMDHFNGNFHIALQ